MAVLDTYAKSLRDPVRGATVIDSLASACALHSNVLPRLEDLLERFPLGAQALLEYLSYSRAGLDRISSDPETLTWLADPAVCAQPLGQGRLRSELASLTPRNADFDPGFTALRQLRGRQMLRIGLRDVAGAAGVEETIRELADLASFCLDCITTNWLADLTRRFAAPATGFAVIGMGKLGGRELNFSSDIDVIFVYGEEGGVTPRLTNHEFFARLAQHISKTFSESSPAGPLFRIDLRLRPEGDTGPIVRSIESMENYYAAMGETWERMALIKARCVCGDAETGYEFLQRLQPFIYPRHIAPDTIDEVAAVKGRIERELLGNARLDRNVKLGRGGIREIEFIVQSFQLLHGSRHAFLQEPNTLKTLGLLSRLNILSEEEAHSLADAYRFLRRVEHRLQIKSEQQTHDLPQDGEDMRELACSLGYASGAALLSGLDTHRKLVRRLFERFIQADPGTGGHESDLSAFAHPAQARRQLAALAGDPGGGIHHAPRTRRVFANLEPLLIQQASLCPDPDRALTGLANFVEAYGARSLLFETLAANPRVLDLMLRLFDSSPFLSRVVLRRPQLLDAITRGPDLGRRLTSTEFLEGLASREENLEPLEWARVYRRAQILRIALRDILGFADVQDLCAEYTDLAEAALRFCARETGVEHDLSVVAFGKFGGVELAYGSDLDVVFIGEDTNAAVRLMQAMSHTGREGALFKLDPRLRPEGDAAPLATPLETFEAYYRSPRAQPWEFQALCKARPILGPEAARFMSLTLDPWIEAGRQPQLFAQVRAMMERVQRERDSTRTIDLKTSRGGLMTVEFVAQALQMRAACRVPGTCQALEQLAEQGHIAQGASSELAGNYLSLRRIELVLRRENNEAISRLPKSAADRNRIAKRCGFANEQQLIAHIDKAREANSQWAGQLLATGE